MMLEPIRTPAPGCPACETKTLHDPDTWEFHPLVGHGYVKETGWSHPDLEPKQ